MPDKLLTLKLHDNRFGNQAFQFIKKNNYWETTVYRNGILVHSLSDKEMQLLLSLLRTYQNKSLIELQLLGLCSIGEGGVDKRNQEIVYLFTLRESDDCIRIDTYNMAGVVTLRDDQGYAVKLEISSRFDSSDKQFFLTYLLSKVADISFWSMTNSGQGSMGNILLAWAFIFLYRQAVKVGLYKQYHKIEYNNLHFKGKLDLDRHLKCNYPIFDKIAYSRRENIFDNMINHLFRHAVEKIRTSYPEIYEAVSEDFFDLRVNTPTWEDSTKHVVLQRKETVSEIRHPYFAEFYEPLRKIARMFLNDEENDIYNTFEDDQVSGIIFDCSWLWEEYLARVLAPEFSHGDTSKPSTGAHHFSDGSGGLIFPDFYKLRNKNQKDRASVILDAKYKMGKENENSADIAQIKLYIFTYGADLGGLIYPPLQIESDDMLKEKIFNQHTVETKKIFHSFAYARISDENYSDFEKFRNFMRTQEEKLKKFANNIG